MKWYGTIAYDEMVESEVEPDVWESIPKEVQYFGDVLKNYKTNQWSQDSTNNDISVSNQISIVADAYLMNYFHKILWVTFGGAKWKVQSVDVQPPRLVLTLGNLYVEEGSSNESTG